MLHFNLNLKLDFLLFWWSMFNSNCEYLPNEWTFNKIVVHFHKNYLSSFFQLANSKRKNLFFHFHKRLQKNQTEKHYIWHCSWFYYFRYLAYKHILSLSHRKKVETAILLWLIWAKKSPFYKICENTIENML